MKIKKKMKNCSTKESILPSAQIFNMTANEPHCQLTCTCDKFCACKTVSCYVQQSFKLAKNRWWFIVLSRCDPINTSFKVLLFL